MELSPTARVILGFLAVEPRSGYDIKQHVDQSTRFFWAASYGQIYPELKRLAEQGMVEADGPAGERRRTVYRLTPAGTDALAEWIRAPEQTHEMRDEGLLKMFFAGMLEPADAIEVLERKRADHVRKLDQLHAVEEMAKTTERRGPYSVLQYGIEMAEMAIAWCDRVIAEMKEQENV